MKKQITLAQLEAAGDNWHGRAHKLREIWQDETRADEYREKARRLWVKMVARVVKIASAIMQAHLPKFPKDKFPSGGIVLPKVDMEGEFVVPRKRP